MGPPLPTDAETILHRIIQGYRPLRVILFGSRADGRPDKDSDLDLLIIKDTEERPWERARHVRRLLRGTRRETPLDLVVLTPAEVEARIRGGTSSWRTSCGVA